MAGEVSVAWRPDAEDAVITSRSGALQAGLGRAVVQDALSLLPGELDEERVNMLRQRLLDKAWDYVLSYSERGLDVTEDEQGTMKTLRLDVTVNRPALKKELKRLGVFYTVATPQAFDIHLTDGASDAWDDLGRLQRFTGVRVRSGASPLLQISRDAEGVWTGRLSQDDDFWIEADKGLTLMWDRLWGHFFTRPGADAGLVSSLTLIIQGWYAPDGAKAFDAELRSWDKALESADLTEVHMLPDGIAATWRVATLDREALKARLDEYLPPRGLSYSFDALP
ncbi:hypothetical protein JCM16814_31130 [Desulfobaculum senezii]